MTERQSMSPGSAVSGRPVDRSAVEHVRVRCPALIATLVAMARAAQDDHGLDGRQVVTTSHGGWEHRP